MLMVWSSSEAHKLIPQAQRYAALGAVLQEGNNPVDISPCGVARQENIERSLPSLSLQLNIQTCSP